ncbi:hypothetical protein K488DRAFT_40518 [Vararia minispora EC-137]|uniref:Uncharacterized protein n=1 Tax=Vararia minispora EC-137 TaxID=1314806 RepID=A0ACB8QYQ3_9AGAM|nr:hypothetical protein K488DRAFT_40518 [Vararia minispora EC-137]
MSMYPPSPQPYGQYPAHHMPHQVSAVPFNGGFAPPAGPSYYALDPASFRRDYASRLSELTVNSRPIIQGLSLYAQEYSRWADAVVECVEAHVRRVPPFMKLPALYLIDAVSKNVYNPYARFFASVVAPLFLETYAQVDQQTRSKMAEMLLTWRTGAPGGRELFGVGPQVAIERGIWGSGPDLSQASQHGSISKQQVLSELEFALNQKERVSQANPYDTTLSGHVHILQQLRKLVEAGVSQQELAQILTQLRSLVQPTVQVPPPASVPLPQPYPGPSSYIQPQPQTFSPAGPSQPPRPEFHGAFERPLAFSPHAQVPVASAPAAPMPPVSVPDVSSLFQSLVKSGILSNTGTPIGAGATAKAETPETDVKLVGDFEKDDVRAYRAAVLAEPVGFSSAEITKHRPNVDFFLYDRLSAQCGQCGIRFSDTAAGKKSMQDHLDEHFRANRKANQGSGRGHSRSLFIVVDDWLNETSANRKGKGRAGGVRRQSGKTIAAAEEARRLADLHTRYVVVPAGDEAKVIACPVCKEVLRAEFNEDDEEWIWKNARSVDGRIYHATCHAEAANSVSSLATRLLSGRSATPPDGPQSRAPSPQVKKESSPAPISLSGVKRKAEPDSSQSFHTTGGTPPLKKAMLASSVA